MKWNENHMETSPQTSPVKCDMNELMDQYKSWNELNMHPKCNCNNNYV